MSTIKSLIVLCSVLAVGLPAGARCEALHFADLAGDYTFTRRVTVPNAPAGLQDTDDIENCLRLRKRGDDRIDFKVFLMGESGAVCSVSGVGKITDNSVLIESNSDDDEMACRMKVEVHGDKLVLREGAPPCQKWHCAKENKFEGAEFPRGSRKVHSDACGSDLERAG